MNADKNCSAALDHKLLNAMSMSEIEVGTIKLCTFDHFVQKLSGRR